MVVSFDSGGAGTLEAADLAKSHDHEFIRRGLPCEDAKARQIQQMGRLQFQIARIHGTESEGKVLPEDRQASFTIALDFRPCGFVP
jgi:hypothetical protein